MALKFNVRKLFHIFCGSTSENILLQIASIAFVVFMALSIEQAAAGGGGDDGGKDDKGPKVIKYGVPYRVHTIQ
jgi:hypothetical protein